MCPTLTANMGTGDNVPLLKDDLGIRKLTPRECFYEGFPKSLLNFLKIGEYPIIFKHNAVTVKLSEKFKKYYG